MTMQRIIDDETASELKAKFDSELVDPVDLILFEGNKNKEYSEWVKQLLKELSELSNKLVHRVHNIILEPDVIEKYRVIRVPTILIGADMGYLIRYTGAPAGHEAWGFVETISLVSQGNPDLSEESMRKLDELSDIGGRIRLVTFVTPTCPYCPHQVLLSNKIAVALRGIVESDCVEAYENPDLADKHKVSAVPHNLITFSEGDEEIVLSTSVGVQPEEKMVEDLIEAVRRIKR
ncbi:MAG: thioredoxin family protein [Candidatus Methanodesulfokora sp.]